MDLILVRTSFESCGIFGALEDEFNRPMATTLEHAYPTKDQFYVPKLLFGTYTCVRGVHQLEKHDPFETFEITGVPGHSGILFHVGNINADSSGCVLLGLRRMGAMIIDSRVAFAAFMKKQEGVDQFKLVVK